MKSKTSWTEDVVTLLADFPPTFTTEEAYGMEGKLRRKHPHNKNIRAKIRQQLQILRDKTMLKSERRGVWTKIITRRAPIVTFRRIAS